MYPTNLICREGVSKLVEGEVRIDEKEITTEEGEEIKIHPDIWAEARRVHPEWFAGTPEWALRVRLEAAQKMYDETGIIMMM